MTETAGGDFALPHNSKTMTKEYRQTRLLIETSLLMRRFGEVEYEENFEWLIIRRFPLPRGFRPRVTNLLLWIPKLYPLIPPCSFAISSDLEKRGVPIMSANNLNSCDWRSWLYLQLPNVRWRASYDISSHDNLLTLMNQIFDFLRNL